MDSGGGGGAVNLLPPTSPARQYFALLRLHRQGVWGRGVGVGGALDTPATSLLSHMFDQASPVAKKQAQGEILGASNAALVRAWVAGIRRVCREESPAMYTTHTTSAPPPPPAAATTPLPTDVTILTMCGTAMMVWVQSPVHGLGECAALARRLSQHFSSSATPSPSPLHHTFSLALLSTTLSLVQTLYLGHHAPHGESLAPLLPWMSGEHSGGASGSGSGRNVWRRPLPYTPPLSLSLNPACSALSPPCATQPCS